MCGIVGYIGRKEAAPLLIEGLRRLEYRGYDSAGICTLADGALQVRKRVGRVDGPGTSRCGQDRSPAPLGISHTRWATHGLPSDINAHPHLDQSGNLALVHNGMIENYAALRHRSAAGPHVSCRRRIPRCLPPGRLSPRQAARSERRRDARAGGSGHLCRHAPRRKAPTPSASCTRTCPGTCSARGAARRWWSALATARTSWPATFPPSSPTPARSSTCTTATWPR